MQLTDRHRQRWQRTLRIAGHWLLIGFVVSLVSADFVLDLNLTFCGWPLSFWVAGQGAPIVYVLILGIYAHCMNRLDQAFGVAETEAE